MAINLFNVKTFAFFLRCSSFKLNEGLVILYRLVLIYHTLFHLRLNSFSSSPPPQGLSRKYTHFTQHSQNTTQHLLLIYKGISVNAGLCSGLFLKLFSLFNRQKRQPDTWTVVGLPAAKFKALVVPMAGLFLSNCLYIWIFVIQDNLRLSPA
jgi:hypothetical protein